MPVMLCEHAVSNLIVSSGAVVEADALKQTGSVNVSHRVRAGVGTEECRDGAVESVGEKRQRQASSCAVSSSILGRRTVSAAVVTLVWSGSQRLAAFPTPAAETCMQWAGL